MNSDSLSPVRAREHPSSEDPPVWRMALLALRRTGALYAHALWDACTGPVPRRGRRLLFLAGFLPAHAMWMTIQWAFLLLDEVLAPGYRAVAIRQPVFVLGPPRSGTTHLHRVLAQDRERFTTCSTLELFAAPSVLQKRLLQATKSVDRALGRPLGRLVRWIENRSLGGLDATHPSGLHEPEEDFFLLLPVQACFALALFFPRWAPLFAMILEQDPASAADRRLALSWYRRCLQKHLYVAGTDRTLLSKNASFSAWIEPLIELFPDARILCCDRAPSQTVPSMLSLADGKRKAAAVNGDDAAFHARMIQVMRAHYQALARYLPALPPDRWAVVDREDQRLRLADS
ncbi:MAG: sulfotransferase, partial [Anaerolineae bacterium]